MSIKVIALSTKERDEETKQLFKECIPYLEQGHSLNYAVRKVKGITHHSISHRAWYRELRQYAKSQGYEIDY